VSAIAKGGGMTLVIVIIVAVVLVAGLGLLIVSLMRRAPKAVPKVVDREGVERKHVVAVDDEGRAVLATDAEDAFEARDDTAFEAVLDEELKDRRG
jgi:Na+-transporting NADH:ubiquinone oxidoreductase subunit NqrD